MEFMRAAYGKQYAPNTRETVRRQTIHQFEQARVVDRNPDDPSRPTNSGKTVYRLTDHVTAVIRAYGDDREFRDQLARFLEQFGSLQAAYSRARDANRVPLRLPDGRTLYLSPGRHNKLQVAIIEEFGPRFAPGAEVLYVGDTADKQITLEAAALAALSVVASEHQKLPDIILYQREKNWLYIVEAVTSHGPISPKRQRELKQVLAQCPADTIYVTAFPSTAEFRKYAAQIAWETEVWIADNPDHMIHFNGPKFLGPYRSGPTA
ncbi:MAG: Type-2 restriction enzyme AplI [Phycisphaerae bacterium]|nr:Type-2 restriction enzyme AplI [Phycisphaerae bacterium]